MRIIKDPAVVSSILRDRDWQMAGPVKRMLGPLLGEGVILATGDAHTQLRKQLGKMPRPDFARIIDAYTPPSQPTDLGDEMSRLSGKRQGRRRQRLLRRRRWLLCLQHLRLSLMTLALKLRFGRAWRQATYTLT